MEKMNFNVNNAPTHGSTINHTEAVVETTNEAEPLKIVPIADYNGDYWISNYGQVFSNKKR